VLRALETFSGTRKSCWTSISVDVGVVWIDTFLGNGVSHRAKSLDMK
jgi:hypothetical protein